MTTQPVFTLATESATEIREEKDFSHFENCISTQTAQIMRELSIRGLRSESFQSSLIRVEGLDAILGTGVYRGESLEIVRLTILQNRIVESL